MLLVPALCSVPGAGGHRAMRCSQLLSEKQSLPPRAYRNPDDFSSVLVSFLPLGLLPPRPYPDSCATARVFVLDRNKREKSGGSQSRGSCSSCVRHGGDKRGTTGSGWTPARPVLADAAPCQRSRCCRINVGTRDVQQKL